MAKITAFSPVNYVFLSKFCNGLSAVQATRQKDTSIEQITRAKFIKSFYTCFLLQQTQLSHAVAKNTFANKLKSRFL